MLMRDFKVGGRKLKLNLFYLIFTLVFSANAGAAGPASAKDAAFKSFFEEFQRGGYAKAAEILQKLTPKERADTKVRYWEAVALTKLQRFDLAAPLLNKVVADDKDRKFEDAAYLLGQSMYSTKDYKGARKAFAVALKQNYKLAATLYYLGYVENLLGNDEVAIELFQKILALPKEDTEYRQPATFQIAEAKFEIASRLPQATKADKIAKHGTFAKDVLPAYQAVLAIDQGSSLSQQAQTRISAINALYGLAPAVEETAAGIPNPKKSWSIDLTEDIKYDTNLTNEASGKLISVSYTGAVLSKTGLAAKNEFIFRKWIVVTPELLSDITYHGARGNPAVYTNDSFNLNPAVRSRLDHKLWKRAASGLLEYEFGYNLKDRLKAHSFDFNYSSHNIVIGERAEPFPFGSTTAKFSYKFNNNVNDGNDYGAPKFSLAQNVEMGKYNWNTTLSFEAQNARDPSNDQKTYGWNNSLSGPKYFWDVSADLSLNFTITDTMHQAPARGTERTIAPGITFTKPWNKIFSSTLTYNYTDNHSKDKANFDYSKSVVGIGIKATL